ncbi:MAG: cysteine hydrolase [Bifidobacteriaceae bacterium]|jgi:nicotinamidase-related amidase|nr:cysteine hydrolase [Bifidobacteriaceae bacterium]
MTKARPTYLVVIDMQRVFAEPGSEWKTPRFEEIIEPVKHLVRAYAPHVVFTRFIAPPAPAGAWVAYYQDWPFALAAADHPMWQIVPELADAAVNVIDRPTFSKWGEKLAELLAPDGQMVLAGVSTDCCVIATALAAADAGVQTLVVREACAGVDDASHAQALHVMDLFQPLIKVVSLAEARARRDGG